MNIFQPLADRMRPTILDDFVGQEELVGKRSFLRGAIEEDRVPSMILWGPPGSGKTTLAHIIAQMTKADFVRLTAVGSGVRDVRAVIERAEQNQRVGTKTILFVDEIHRWNKAQQDALLPHVEKGTIILIGATTENPSFEVNSALISRARVFVLKRLGEEALMKILKRAMEAMNHESPKSPAKAGPTGQVRIMNQDGFEEVLQFIVQQSNGDARMALSTLEACISQQGEVTIELVKEVLQKQHLMYDKDGEEHYNIISALHKSMRGGDADAAVYWLVRMLEVGEDPLYIARRLVRFASEDIGLANNTALILANAAFDACHKLGMPECGVHLAHVVIFMSLSKKSITAYEAYERAKKDVEQYGNLGVPLHIRNAPTKLMRDLGYGKGYKYTPKEDSSEQTYLPEELKGRKYVDV